ncbi:MAG: HAD family phosphatase [Candidatus Omnitrophota bacterium]
MKDNKKIKTIFFDLGNVIVKLDPMVLEREYAARGRVKEGEVIEYFMDSDEINRYAEGKLTSSQFYNRTRRRFKMDIKYNDFYRLWNEIFLPYPEMEDIIRNLKKGYPDIKLILVSNTNESHFDFVKDKYNILDLLDAHVASHELGAQKPRPKIFQEALRIAGSLPKETFYTDDREDLIDAAKVMGIRAFHFTGHTGLREHLAEFGVNV